LLGLTFHNWYALRRAILRGFGARVGPGVRVRASVLVEQPWNLELGAYCSVGDRAILYCLGPVMIGPRAALSQGVHVCAGTHDYNKPQMPLLRPPITVGADAWVAAEAFIGPGVVVGERCVIGARSVVVKDTQAGFVYAGNPARKLKARDQSGDTGPA
jgi:putative colanic acid biosynthesis acetyltransferase WcaF